MSTTTPTIVITRPIDEDNSDPIDKSFTDFSRRIAIENLLNPKHEILPSKVPRIFRQVVFEKVKLKGEKTEDQSEETQLNNDSDCDDDVFVEDEKTIPKLKRNVFQSAMKEDPDRIQKVSEIDEEVQNSNW
jgi:hypothetical protein